MKYCKRCLQPNTRPNIVFNEAQICYACLYEDNKNKDIDWSGRRAELEEIAHWAKNKAQAEQLPYDCVIGVSGGKDSTFQAIYAKEKLGLRVLLVNSAPDNISSIGRKNLENLSQKGFDLLSIRPNPLIAKKMAKHFFFTECNIVKPSEFALWSSAYIIAEKFNIPLIIQGENAALTLGVVSKQKPDGDAFGVVDLQTLGGCKSSDLLCDGVVEEDVYLYNFPNVEKMKEKGIRAIWLQYYAKEWSQVYNADFAIARGLEGRTDSLYNIGRYRRYTALDSDFAIVNQMLKYYKLGFGFTTDEACYDIREGRITREDATWLVNEYDGKCGKQYIGEFCEYINITEDEFWSVVDRFVNKKLFSKISHGVYKPKFRIGEDCD